MTTLSKEALAESEIILNKTNIALARSRKLIQSWLSQPAAESQEDEDEDEDFKPESETAGIGSTVQDDESGSLGRIARSRQANDKLLEQILGKTAAQAHRRSQQTVSSTKPAPKVDENSNKRQNNSDDDNDQGRASAVASGRVKKSKHYSTNKIQVPDQKDPLTPTNEGEASKQQNRLGVSSKRKANSYLDELLAKKARKKSKKG
ncbi:hypothetical protein AMS68_000897 [Peltaster fructicola]|uniref:Uncharacterized protein n=1 Tax=Peltaster fructicola TaxID=286661 RepID=A0A6H0XLJ5_9PEZI|nr:hypothetical protein AMS68_000897 [Peltaster fructicola]